EIVRTCAIDSCDHSTGYEALPNQLVELGLVGVEEGAHLVGSAQDGGGPDGLVRLLGAPRLGLARRRLGRNVVLAELLLDEGGGLFGGYLRYKERAGSHIGDETHEIARAHADALVAGLS